MKSPNSTPPTSPITSPLNSPSPITSPNLSSESKKILDFLVNCANQDRLKAEILVDDKNKIELKENNNKNNKFTNKLINMKHSEENIVKNKDNIENKIIKVNKKKKNKNKCALCNKKLPLMPIVCKCGYKFCGIHRHPEDHQCSFDYKTQQQKLLRDKNPQIISNKIIKI